MTGATLLVTDSFVPSPQALFALASSGALDAGGAEHPVVLATFTPEVDRDVGFVERRGVSYLPLGRLGASTIEQALAGAASGFAARRVLVWAAPRALLALPAVRDLPDRPAIEVHLPAENSTPWDETELVAVRAQNLIDRYIVEDEATTARLLALGVRRRQITAAPARPEDGGEIPSRDATHDRVYVVHGATWQRAKSHAGSLAHDLRAGGRPRATPLDFRGVFRLLVDPPAARGARRGTMVFPETAISSAEVFTRLLDDGWRVAMAPGPICDRVSRHANARALSADPAAWAGEIAATQ